MPPYERVSATTNIEYTTPTVQSSYLLSSSSNNSTSRRYNSNSYISEQNSDEENEIKSALISCENSIVILFDYLRKNGVSRVCIEELCKGIPDGQGHMEVLQRTQKYTGIYCIQDPSIHYLLISCWTTILRYYTLKYKKAYKYHHTIRRQYDGLADASKRILASSFIDHCNEIDKALQIQIHLAEQCCTCQKELYLANKREKFMTITRNTNNNNDSTDDEQRE